jgi:hypothetical protein
LAQIVLTLVLPDWKIDHGGVDDEHRAMKKLPYGFPPLDLYQAGNPGRDKNIGTGKTPEGKSRVINPFPEDNSKINPAIGA